MSGPAVVVDGLSKRYANVVALDALSFDAPAGSIVGLLGPNGSGKTTTVSVLPPRYSPTPVAHECTATMWCCAVSSLEWKINKPPLVG